MSLCTNNMREKVIEVVLTTFNKDSHGSTLLYLFLCSVVDGY